jgi:hypothetical protein
MSNLPLLLSHAETESRLREAQARRRAALNGRQGRSATDGEVVVRLATDNDRAALARLAQLEGRMLPDGATLLAERHGVVLAAISIETAEAIADPFRPTADLVELLRRSGAGRLDKADRQHRRRRSRLRRLAFFRRPGAGAPAVPGTEQLLIR